MASSLLQECSFTAGSEHNWEPLCENAHTKIRFQQVRCLSVCDAWDGMRLEGNEMSASQHWLQKYCFQSFIECCSTAKPETTDKANISCRMSNIYMYLVYTKSSHSYFLLKVIGINSRHCLGITIECVSEAKYNELTRLPFPQQIWYSAWCFCNPLQRIAAAAKGCRR